MKKVDNKICVIGSGVGAFFSVEHLINAVKVDPREIEVLTTGSLSEMDMLYRLPSRQESDEGHSKKMTGIIPEKLLFGSSEIYSHHRFHSIDLSNLKYKPKVTSHLGGLTHVWGANLSLIPEADFKISGHLRGLRKYDEVIYEAFNASGYMAAGRSSKLALLSPRLLYLSSPHVESRLKKRMSDCAHNKFRVYFSNLAINVGDGPSGCTYCGKCLTGCKYQSIWSAGGKLKELLAEFNFILTENARVLRVNKTLDGISVEYSLNGELKRKLYSKVLIGAGVLDTIDILANSNLLKKDSTISDSRKYYTLFFMPKKADINFEENSIALSNITYQFDTRMGSLHSQIYPSIDILNGVLKSIPLPMAIKNYVKTHFSIGMVYLPEGLSENVKLQYLDERFALVKGSLSVFKRLKRIKYLFEHYIYSFFELMQYGYFKLPIYHAVPHMNSQHYGNLQSNEGDQINDILPDGIFTVDSSALGFVTGIPTTLLVGANARHLIDERFSCE